MLDEERLAMLDRSRSDSLSEQQLVRRIADLYRQQSNILIAQLRDDEAATDTLLQEAMDELRRLSKRPEALAHRRFRELYRTLVHEHEAFYGTPDPELSLPRGGIFALREDMFAALDLLEDPLLNNVEFPEGLLREASVPMTQNRLTQRSTQFLLDRKDTLVPAWLERADTYFPMIEQILAEEGVPDEMKYLSLVESALNPRARSWAGAVGMWQFMPGTGRLYDLDINPWVDERMDPEKATYAAARHLRDLYDTFGDWHLVLAAYNAGTGRVRGAMRRAGYAGRDAQPTYWDIYDYLPRETRNYVPMFIATSMVASNPEAFDVPPHPPGARYAYDHVPVQGMLSLREIAEMAGTQPAVVRALNPELRRATLPPTENGYMVRLPQGTYATFAAAYEALPDAKKKPVSEHVVRRGDVLGRIANRYGVSVRQLMRVNNLNATTIHPGQRLVVPVQNYDGPGIADASPLSVQYGSRLVRPIAPYRGAREAQQRSEQQPPVVRAADERSVRPTPPEAPEGSGGETTRSTDASDAGAAPAEEDSRSTAETAASEPATSETRIVYHVRRGDTLGGIAQRHGVSVASLRSWNSLSGNRIRAGQQLELYTDTPPAEPLQYTVRRGDTLGQIANRHGVSVSALQQWNSLAGTRIRPGQTLTIHRDGSAPDYIVYRVRSGDTLGGIANRHGVSVRNLQQWNGISGTRIRPGQRLTVRP
jgi:membrane-bound lytic murein transglycosylase D